MRLGYLGPEGTFSEEALRRSLALAGVRAGEAELVPLPTVHAVVLAVADGEVNRALAPIENSLEGSVNEAVDALLHEAPGVRIVGETVLPVHYVLAARAERPLESITAVYSHPQSLAQCARFLREAMPGAEVRATRSTADAVRSVAASDEPSAALGTRLAAELYGLRVLREDVQDDAGNATRFVWLAAQDDPLARAARAADPHAPWKSSVAFLGDGDGDPGWLVRCLSEFAFRGVNLTRIESRPARRRLGHYVFLVDLDGRADHAGPAADAIAALAKYCEDVRVLGAYPAAGAPGAQDVGAVAQEARPAG
ncbi:MAG TPA: prephenate dehydratase [Solirubrobacteraceae bacterium]|nr:prephenate dehydratase [Solirubrobacteraceae bacterium]